MVCSLAGLIGGIDEAGRGPLAGPVVSSCVIWKNFPCEREAVKDSKLLTEKKRQEFFKWIFANSYKVGIGTATHEEIEKAVSNLVSKNQALIVRHYDGYVILAQDERDFQTKVSKIRM